MCGTYHDPKEKKALFPGTQYDLHIGEANHGLENMNQSSAQQ
jgi:hypothetical protein